MLPHQSPILSALLSRIFMPLMVMAPSPIPPFILPCLLSPVRTSLLGNIYRLLSVFIHTLEMALEEVMEMLDRFSEYVARVVVCFLPLG